MEDRSATSTTLCAERSNYDDEERCSCKEEWNANNLVSPCIAPLLVLSSKELTHDTPIALGEVNNQKTSSDLKIRDIKSVANEDESDFDKGFQQKIDPAPNFLTREKNQHQSDFQTASMRPRRITGVLRSHDETQAMVDHDGVKSEEDESDSLSEFEWKPVKCSKVKGEEVQWEDKNGNVFLKDNQRVEHGESFIKSFESNKKEYVDEQEQDAEPSLQLSSLSQVVAEENVNWAKRGHNAGRLFPELLPSPLLQEGESTHQRTDSSARLKKSSFPRSHFWRSPLPASKMDDKTYLRVFGIDKLLSNLAMALLEQKPENHVEFARKWIELLIDMERKGDKKEAEGSQSYHSYQYYGKRSRGKNCGSLEALSLSVPASVLASTGYTGGVTDVFAPSGDLLTKRRLKEVLRSQFNSRRGSRHVAQHHPITRAGDKPGQKQSNTRFRRLKPELRRGSIQSSENSVKGTLKRRRCFSKVKLSDKVNDYLSKVEVTGLTAATGSTPDRTNAALVGDVDMLSPLCLHTLVPTTEGHTTDGVPFLPEKKTSWTPPRNNDLTSSSSPLNKAVGTTSGGSENDIRSVLSATVELNPAKTHSSSNTRFNISATALFHPVELSNATVSSPSPIIEPRETVLSHKAGCGESKKQGLGDHNKDFQRNSLAVSSNSNSCLKGTQSSASDLNSFSPRSVTKLNVAPVGSFSPHTRSPSAKDLDVQKYEGQKKDSEDVDNDMVTFAPVITLDQTTTVGVGDLRVLNEKKTVSMNTLPLSSASGQAAAASAVSTPRVPGARNNGKEAATNARGSRLTSATADIPAKLLAAIAPTTISNANRAAQQKLVNSGIAVSAGGAAASKLSSSAKAASVMPAISSETNLQPSRTGAHSPGYNQGSGTTIGTARLKLHSLASGSDTTTTKTKLGSLGGTGEHSNPTLRLTSTSVSPSASALSLSQMQAHSRQPYSGSLGIALTANQNATSGAVFPSPQSPLYTSESAVDNRVDLVPFSSIEYTEKATPKGEKSCGNLSLAMPADSSSLPGLCGPWVRGMNPIVVNATASGSEGDAKLASIPNHNSLTDADVLSPRISSLMTGSNVMLGMGSSSSTAWNFSPVNSLLKRRGESVLTNESGGCKWISDRHMTPTDPSLTAMQTELMARIHSTLPKVPKKMYSKVLSFLEGLVGKSEEGDSNGLGFLSLNSISGGTGFSTSPLFRQGAQNVTFFNYSNGMHATGVSYSHVFGCQKGRHRTDSIPIVTEKFKSLSKGSDRSSKMHRAWSCPTLSALQWERMSIAGFDASPLCEVLGAPGATDVRGFSHPPEDYVNTQMPSQVNHMDEPSQNVTPLPLLERDAARVSAQGNFNLKAEHSLLSRGKILGLQSSIRAFAASVAPYPHLQAATTTTTTTTTTVAPIAHGQCSFLHRTPDMDSNSNSIDTITERPISLHSTGTRRTAQPTYSRDTSFAMLSSRISCNKTEGILSPVTRGLSPAEGHGCETLHGASSFDHFTDKGQRLEANTAINASLAAEISPSTLPSISPVAQALHVPTVLGPSISESNNQNLKTSTEDVPVGMAENDLQSSAYRHLKASFDGENFETSKPSDATRCGSSKECGQLSTDTHLEMSNQQNQDLTNRDDDNDASTNQLRNVNSDCFIGGEQDSTKVVRSQCEWDKKDETLIDLSRPPGSEVLQSCLDQTSQEQGNHENEGRLRTSFTNTNTNDSTVSKLECVLLPPSDSQLAATCNAIDLLDMGKLCSEKGRIWSAPTTCSKYSETDASSTDQSTEFFSKSLFSPLDGTKLLHRYNRTHSEASKSTLQRRRHHLRYVHPSRGASKVAINGQKWESRCLRKAKPSCSGQDQTSDCLGHEPLGGFDNSLQCTETADVKKSMMTLSKVCNSQNNVFLTQKAHLKTSHNERQPRRVSITFGDKIYELPKPETWRGARREAESVETRRSLSDISHVLHSKRVEGKSCHRKKEQRHQRALYKHNTSLLADCPSKEKLEDLGSEKTTKNFPPAKDEKTPTEHHTHGKGVSHLQYYHSAKVGKARLKPNTRSASTPSSPKELGRSLLERTLNFLNRKGHFEVSDNVAGDNYESFVSVRSPMCALGDAPCVSSVLFAGGQSERGTMNNPKLDCAIAMTALAIAEGQLNSPCESAASNDRLLNMADFIYSKEVNLSANREDCSRTARSGPSHSATNSLAQNSKSMLTSNGRDASAQGAAPSDAVVEKSVNTFGKEENGDLFQPAPNGRNNEAPCTFTEGSGTPAVVSNSTGEKPISTLPLKGTSSVCSGIGKALLEGSTTTTSFDSLLKELDVLSEELNSILEAVSNNTILTTFDLKHLRMLIHAMSRKVLNADDTLVQEGEAWVDSLIFVVKGCLSTLHCGSTSQTIMPGSIYGEVEFFKHTERSPVTLASNSASGATVFLLPNKDFQNLVMLQKDALKVFLVKFIDQIPLFKTCPTDIKQRLAGVLKPHRIEQGTTLMRCGNPVEWLYIIVSGDLNLIFLPEVHEKEHESSMAEPASFRSCFMSSRSDAKGHQVSPKGSMARDYNSLSVSEQTNDAGQQWENPIQAPQHLADDVISLTTKNDAPGSTERQADSPLPCSTQSSEDANNTSGHHWLSALSLPTSIFVDNKRIPAPQLAFDAFQSDTTVDQQSLRPRHQQEEREGPFPSFDSSREQLSFRRSSGCLMGEIELVFGTKSLFTCRAETTLHVVRVDRLHFDIIMRREVLDEFKRTMLVHPLYNFLKKMASKKMRDEMNSIGLNQTVNGSKSSPREMKTGSTLSSAKWFDGKDDKKNNQNSQHRKHIGRKISKLASVERLPQFRNTSSMRKLSRHKDDPRPRSKSVMNTATRSLNHSHSQPSENAKPSKGNATSQALLHSYRSLNSKHPSAGSSLRQHISPDGEIVFSGGGHLYRFPLEALCANNTIVIGIVMDGTIIQWNPTAHHVTGYAPFEVIGQSIFDFMSCEESRQKLHTMLKAAKQYSGKWETYVAAELNLQKIFSFRQNTGLYQIGVALSVIPSMCLSSSEVFLLVGRESKYHAAANYSADVVSWLNERMRPQLANFQFYVSYIESKNWMVTPNDAILLRGHLDACMVTVEHLARLSLLTMETVKDSLRPTQLIIPIRHFITEACALVRNTNCTLFCKTDDITPTVRVFLDAEKVIMFLRLLLKDLLNSVEYDPTMHVDIELRVTIIEPEGTHLGQHLKQNITRQQQLRQHSQQQGQDHVYSGANGSGTSGAVASLAGGSVATTHANSSNSPYPSKNPALSVPEASKSPTGAALLSNPGDPRESKSSVAYSSPHPQSTSSAYPTSNAEQGESIDLQLSSLRRICFELRDNGLPIPLCHASSPALDPIERAGAGEGDSEEDRVGVGVGSEGRGGGRGTDGPCRGLAQTVLTPTTRFAGCEPPLAAPYNSPVVSNAWVLSFSGRGANAVPPVARHRGAELAHVEKIVSGMGGVLRCFTRLEVGGNVVRVELPLLAVPGSKEEVEEDAGTVHRVAPGGRSFTVIVADNNHVHQNHLCQILWSRQHAVIPVRSFDELMRKIKSNTADILIIDPMQIDLNMDDYIKRHGRDPFGDILESTSRMVLVVVGMDFTDWRVQKLLDRNSVIEVPKLGSAALIHIAMQEAEQMVAEMRDEEDRIEQLRSNFTNSAAGRHKVGRLLGKGAFGDVYEVKDTLTSGKMAMKRMQLHEGCIVDEVVQEILAMTSLKHENIIGYFYCEKESDTMLRIYMELAPGGTLRDRIRENPGVGLPFEEVVQRLTDICRGLAYVHSQHYVHCDLKTANLLLGTRGRTKIGDFGTAKQLAPDQKLYKLLGTPQYMAPEVLMADAQQRIGYDYKADVWSVGCIALEMATGSPPFLHIEQSHGMGIIKYLSELTDTPDLSPLFSGSPLIYEFVKACLEINPELRPSAQELLHFDILQGMRTSIRAERIMRRAEMLHKLNKYTSIREENQGIPNTDLGEGNSGFMNTIYNDGDGTIQANYFGYKGNLRRSVSSSTSFESSFTSTSSSGSALSSEWSVESLQPTLSSKN